MKLTSRSMAEIAGHEGVVLEAYKDSVGVWTWGVGLTNFSGHKVYPRYKDNPQTLQKVIDVFEFILRKKYLPDVLAAFKGHDLTENELAAAVSFHYNTGGIKRASWVKTFLKGDVAGAKIQFMAWKKPPSIIKRREAERDLFFGGAWGDGNAQIIPVKKPSYKPDFKNAKTVKVDEILELNK